MKRYILALFAVFVCSALFSQTTLKVVVGTPEPFQKVDQLPTFNGGSVNDFSKWVEENIVLPDNINVKDMRSSLLALSFTVQKDGSVTNVKSDTEAALFVLGLKICPSRELHQELVRVISSSQGWQPAIHKGKAVKITFGLMVTFREQDSGTQPQMESVKLTSKEENNAKPDRSVPVKKEIPQENPAKSDVDNIAARTNRTAANTFALIIANENYHNVSAVEYAMNDGKMFSEYCDKVLGVPQSNIRLYTDATLGTIYSAVKFIEKVGEAYDGEINLIVYYAGHGIPDETSKDAYIIPTDGDGSVLQSCIKLSDLYGRLAEIKSKSTVVFMDACFSGSLRGDGMLASARGVAIASKPAKVGGNMVVISAAQGDETAYPLKSEGHGLFTYYLLKNLQETGGNATLGEMSDYIIREVKRRSITTNGKIQTPSVLPSAVATDWRNWKL